MYVAHSSHCDLIAKWLLISSYLYTLNECSRQSLRADAELLQTQKTLLLDCNINDGLAIDSVYDSLK